MSRSYAQDGIAWLSRERLMVWLTILTLTEGGLFLFFAAGAHGLIVPLDHPGSTDFLSFHAAGALAGAGTPWLAYDRLAHQAAETAAIGFPTPYNYFLYPPVFLLLCAPLARLPYLVSFVLFQMLSGLACLYAARLIRPGLSPLVLLAFPGFWWAIGTGQNALLTAALFAAGTALIGRRPWLAGMCFGALCYKPHFGLLIPVALIAGGHGRAIAGAALSAASLCALSLAVFGVETWTAFLRAAARSDEIYAANAIFMGGLTSPYGVLMTLGAGREIAFTAQACVIVLTAAAVALVWRWSDSPAARGAILLAATPIAVPVLMFYDLMLVFLALLWLTRLIPWRMRRREGLAMGAVFLGALCSGNLSAATPLLFAAMTAALAFGLTLALCVKEGVLAGLGAPPLSRPA